MIKYFQLTPALCKIYGILRSSVRLDSAGAQRTESIKDGAILAEFIGGGMCSCW